MAVTHSTTVRNAITDLVVGGGVLNNGRLVFRTTGTVGSPGTACATLTLAATAFGASSGGTATANAITSDTNAAGGTVATATLETSGSVVRVHCAVGTSGSDININALTVNSGDTVSCSALTYSAPA